MIKAIQVDPWYLWGILLFLYPKSTDTKVYGAHSRPTDMTGSTFWSCLELFWGAKKPHSASPHLWEAFAISQQRNLYKFMFES